MSGNDSLWQFDVEQAKYMTPKRVMQAQAKYLVEMSGGRLTVNLNGRQGAGIREDSSIHEFRVGITKPFEYECTFLEVHQTMDIYPLQVVSGLDSSLTQECATLEEFIEILRTVLNSPQAKRRLAALYSQAYDEMSGEQDAVPTLVENALVSPEDAPPASPTPLTEPASDASSAPPPADGTVNATQELDNDAPTEPVATFPGWTPVAEINKQFGVHLDTSVEDIGTFLAIEIGSRPTIGSRIEKDGIVIQVISTSGTSVGEIQVFPVAP